MNTPPAFAYTRFDPRLYDATIDLVVPRYRDGLAVLREFVHWESKINAKRALAALDLGSGTGTEAMVALEAEVGARVVAVDQLPHLHRVFEEKCESRFPSQQVFQRRVRTVTGNVLHRDVGDRAIEALEAMSGERRFDLVMTAFVSHHFSANDRNTFYAACFEFLRPGGVLLNLDLFSYHDPTVSREAHDFDLAWIARQFSSPDASFNEAQRVPLSIRTQLQKEWLLHYRQHALVPIEADGANPGHGLSLRAAGFRQITVPMRYWQVGVLVARKPGLA